MKKKFFALVMAAFMTLPLAFALAGCGGANDDLGKTDPGRTSIKVWCQATNQAEYFRWVKKEFEAKYPTYGLSITPKNTDDLSSLDIKFAGNSAPDVAATWGGMTVRGLVAGKRVAKLDDVITSDVDATLNDGAKHNKLDGNGTYYSIPLHGLASPVIFYNKSYFDNNNLQVPTTYEELLALSNAIRGDGKQPIAGGFNVRYASLYAGSSFKNNEARRLCEDYRF